MAVHTSRLACRKAGQAGVFTPVRESSGESQFNQKYYTYGTYFEVDGVAKAIGSAFTDPRTVTPAQPLAVYGGVKVRL